MISLCFRLNYNHIEAGLITDHYENRLESPIERRMHIEKETGSILFNQRDLKPNLCVNRVSSVIPS